MNVQYFYYSHVHSFNFERFECRKLKRKPSLYFSCSYFDKEEIKIDINSFFSELFYFINDENYSVVEFSNYNAFSHRKSVCWEVKDIQEDIQKDFPELDRICKKYGIEKK
jgi:hypothetical protein